MNIDGIHLSSQQVQAVADTYNALKLGQYIEDNIYLPVPQNWEQPVTEIQNQLSADYVIDGRKRGIIQRYLSLLWAKKCRSRDGLLELLSRFDVHDSVQIEVDGNLSYMFVVKNRTIVISPGKAETVGSLYDTIQHVPAEGYLFEDRYIRLTAVDADEHSVKFSFTNTSPALLYVVVGNDDDYRRQFLATLSKLLAATVITPEELETLSYNTADDVILPVLPDSSAILTDSQKNVFQTITFVLQSQKKKRQEGDFIYLAPGIDPITAAKCAVSAVVKKI